MKLLAEVSHELCAWRDGIAVKKFGHLLATSLNLRFQKGAFTGTFKSSCSLLIHFSSRSNTINRQEDIFLRLNEMNDFIDGYHNGRPQLLHVFEATYSLMSLGVISVHAVVDNSV